MIGNRVRLDTDIARQAALSARIARGQSDISLGKRIQVASDDPAAAARASQLRSSRIDTAAWSAIADYGATLSARADAALGSVGNSVDRARELMTSAISGTLSAGDRAAIADEIKGLADEIDDIAGSIDATGQRVFPDGEPLELPVGNNVRIAATLSKAAAFTVTTASGPQDIASILRAAATALTSGTVADRNASLDAISVATDLVSTNRGLLGGRAARIDNILNRLSDGDTAMTEELSKLEDTDVAATIARIQADQLALDASRSLFAKVNSRTLFDLLG